MFSPKRACVYAGQSYRGSNVGRDDARQVERGDGGVAMSYEPVPRWKQRLGGVLIAAIGGGGTLWLWHVARSEGHVYLKASVLMPAFLVLGLAMVAIPGYKEERLARGEDLAGLSGVQLLTPRWWIVLVIALAAGLGNLLLLQVS